MKEKTNPTSIKLMKIQKFRKFSLSVITRI